MYNDWHCFLKISMLLYLVWVQIVLSIFSCVPKGWGCLQVLPDEGLQFCPPHAPFWIAELIEDLWGQVISAWSCADWFLSGAVGTRTPGGRCIYLDAYVKRNRWRSQCDGSVVNPPPAGSHILYECRLTSWLLHFPSNSLLVTGESIRG